ncbi:unnamed protein product [Mytilus coruscus]|uniref:Myb/SANT-like DNA-binding domain-containing protein n=1 Tax=Mytilus coruscus TaxID=42192 RepID=A0A6J8ATG0_MYTCO|nr:unnamed protein product [Mytilus coruscus]
MEMSASASKMHRNRSKNFESTEITLITELVQQNITLQNDKFKSSHGTSSVTSEKKRLVWEHITERVNSLGVCPRSTKEIKTKWSNLHQEAKKVFTEKARDHQSFTGLQGVKSPIDAIDKDSSLATTGHDAVDIVGTPQSMSLLSKFVDQFQEGAADSVTANNPGPSSVSEVRVPAASTEDVLIIDVHLTSKKCKTAKRKIKPEDVTRMQFEVLVEQKKKLIQQTTYYELMNKKLKLHLDIED